MDINQKTVLKNTNRMLAANIIMLTVVVLAFSIIIHFFSRIRGFLEDEVRSKVETVVSNSDLSRSLNSLEIDITSLLTSIIRQPSEFNPMSRKVINSFDNLHRKIDKDYAVINIDKDPFPINEYGSALHSLIDTVEDIKLNVTELSTMGKVFSTRLYDMENSAGRLMVSYALGGKNITGLQQTYALIPFCKERISKAQILVEASVLQSNPNILGVSGRAKNSNQETVTDTLLQLTQTLKTLTSATEEISGSARAVLSDIPRYMDILGKLDIHLKDYNSKLIIFNDRWSLVIRTLADIDSQVSSAINVIHIDMHNILSNASMMMYLITAMVLGVSVTGGVFIRKIGRQLQFTANEALEAKAELQQSHNKLELRVQERTADLKKANEQLLQEITERALAENALKDSHERLVTMLDSLESLVYVADIETYEVLFVNKFARDIFGSIEGKLCWQSLQSGQTGPCEFCTNDRLLTSEGEPAGVYRWEFENTMNNNWYLIDDRAIKWVDGRIVKLEIATDISDRKEMENTIITSLEEKEVLLQEIHHRVKNNMTIVHSLLYMQASTVNDETYRELLNESINRIKTMALIHEKLYHSKDLTKIDFNDYLADIANNIASSYVIYPNRIAIVIDVQQIDLCVDDAIPCGLIVNELFSNAMKHAFPDNREGKITLTLQINDQNEVELKITDNGVGIPDDLDVRKTSSLGLNLVDALVKQLRGDIKLQTKQGTCFIITFKRNQ